MAEPFDPYKSLGKPINPSAAKPEPVTDDSYQQMLKLRAIDEARRQAEAQKKAAPPPETDYGKAIGSGVQKGILGIPGSVGDIMGLAALAPQLAMKPAIYLREKIGMPFSEEQKAMMAKNVERGSEAMRSFMPATTESMSEFVQPYAEKIFGVGPQYVPKTEKEAVAKSAFEYGLPAVIGSPTGVVPRVATGIAGAGAAEYAGQKFKGTKAEPYVQAATSVLAPIILEKGIRAPYSKAAEGLVSPDTAAKRNLGFGLADYEAESASLAHQMARSKKISGAAADMPNRMRDFTQQITGVNPTSPQYQKLLDRAGATERTRVYDIARANPNAGAIDVTPMGGLENHPLFKEAEDQARKNAVNAPSFNIVPPSVSGGQQKTMIGAGGAEYKVQTPQTVTPGNLNFYHQMKEELDVIRRKAYRDGDTTRYNGATEVRNKLLETIENAVPEYRDARGIAAQTFGTSDAPEAGAKFFKATDEYKLDEFKNAFNSYTPDQRKAFQVGLLGKLEEEIASKNTQGITNRFLRNPQFMEKLNFAFGPEVAGQVRSKVLSENMLQQAEKIRADLRNKENLKKLSQTARKTGVVAGAGAAAGDLASTQFLVQALSTLGVSPLSATLGIAGGTAALAGQVAMNAVEKRVAGRMIELIKSNDPKTYSQLNTLIDKHPDVYPKMMMILSTIDQANEAVLGDQKKPQLPTEDLNQAYERLSREGKIKPQQADGGRIARANGGQVSVDKGVRALMMAVEQAKKKVSQSTESLLEQPDEHIAQALSMAKRHI